VSDQWEYVQGAELPDAACTWLEWTGQPIQFVTDGYTFQMKIAAELGDAALLTKTAGLTGTDAGVVTVVWASGELAPLPPGYYVVQLRATRPDAKDRVYKFLPLRILPAIT
jgi:hypothetical protein